MNALFNKSLDLLTINDVDRLIKDGYPEGTHIEYKQELPSKNNKVDPWLKGQSHISDYARNQLLKEIVAFANGVGGYLLIGIEESETKPATAVNIKPIPRCAELAEKLRLQVRDCVSPKLPLFYAEGITLSNDVSEGVVIIHVPQSRLAPHRSEPDSQCYKRRNDRSEKMTMREIQDLTLERTRSTGNVDMKFEDRHTKFQNLMKTIFSGEDCHGIRVTLIPISSGIWVDKVHKNQDLQPVQKVFTAQSGNVQVKLYSASSFSTYQNRPILRGSRHYSDSNSKFHSSVQEIYCDGTIEYTFFSRYSKGYTLIHPEWILSFCVNALLMADQFRTYAGFPDFEYGLEIEIARSDGNWELSQFNSDSDRAWKPNFAIEDNPLILPRISVGSRDEFSEIIKIVNQDLWDSAGVESQELQISLPSEESKHA